MSQTRVPAELRRLVRDRARDCCEYCLLPEWASVVSHQVDHIIAEKHGGPTTADNLALCCAVCNKRKGSDLASVDSPGGELIPLWNPRRHRWAEHFQTVGARIEPLTAIGRVTAQLLRINDEYRVAERQEALLLGMNWPPLV